MDWSWAIGGISGNVPRITGSECYNCMTNRRRLIEGVIVTICCISIVKAAIKRTKPLNLTYPSSNASKDYQNDNQQQQQQQLSQQSSMEHQMTRHRFGRMFLLVLLTFVFGLEMGFKFSSKTVIFVLNPCHITTMIQIYILAAKPSKTTTALFRIQMNYLNGPVLACVFPETESRILTLEASTYWVQHALLMIIPIYLIYHGDPYRMEDLMDFNFNIISYAFLLIYHFSILNFLSVLSGVNLNHMLCAAAADPFDGPNYRLSAIVHQMMLCPLLCKLTVYICTKVLSSSSSYRWRKQQQQQNDYKTNLLRNNDDQQLYDEYNNCIENEIMTTKID